MRTTTRYIPEGYELSWDDQDLGIQIYYKDEVSPSGKAIVGGLCFVGKAVKPTWFYRFRNGQERIDEVTSTFKRVRERAEYKATKKAEIASIKHDVKVGDIFQSLWGYDQTNIDYYEVVAVAGKTATIRPIRSLVDSDGYLQGNCVPSPSNFKGDAFKKLIQYTSATSEPHLRLNSFSNAWRIKPVAVISGKPIFSESHWTAYA